MKLDKIVTIVVLALSFCVFDQMKENLVGKINTPEVKNETLTASAEKIHDLIPENLIDKEFACLEKENSDKYNILISVECGKRVIRAILLSKF